jgi:hypothetical protein
MLKNLKTLFSRLLRYSRIKLFFLFIFATAVKSVKYRALSKPFK